MKKTTTLIFALLTCLVFLSKTAVADEFKITGQVTFTADAFPVPEVPVTFASSDGTYFETTTTDIEGNYEIVFDIAAGEQVTATGEVIDFCTGEFASITVDNSQSLEVTADFLLCDFISPPPPNTDCEAFYDYIQPDPAALTYEFTDLSFAGVTINSWSWDFGDGNTASGQQVAHTFAAEGVYPVSLTIVADSCTSEITHLVNVVIDTCSCAFDIAPVCVLDANGDQLTFPNECFANCAGYSAADFVDCNSGCGCTTEFDPVCVEVAGGLQIQFPNECEAFCAGFDSTSIVVCDTISTCPCPPHFDPVCVIAATGDTLTFSNGCYAECEGYTPDTWFDCQNNNCGCTTEYDPVCVNLGGIQIPFPNECEAFCAGFDSTFLVVCDTVSTCPCPNYYDPVCVITATGDTLTFDNGCYAECEGYPSGTWFNCQTSNCGCTSEFDPVCIDLGGIQIPFLNECEALCAGFDSTFLVVCDTVSTCPCPNYYDPVCVITANGDTLTFDNGCYAECEGYTPDTWFDCQTSNCGCTTEYDPVCVDLGGFQIEFPNECEAFCAGFDSTFIVVCDTTSTCPCPPFFDPVCVITAAGDTLTFDNFCYAECEGYGPNEYFSCDGNTGGGCWVDFHYYQADPAVLEVTFETFIASGTIISYLWDFGDGNTSTEANPVHTYAVEGIYDVTLTVEFADGCVASWVNHICIGGGGVVNNPPDCQAFFWFTQGDSTQLNTFNFMDMSMGSDLEYDWDFGDGNTSTEMNPEHTYAEPGTYLVTLNVSNDSCSSTYSMFLFTDPSGWYSDECNALFLPAIDTNLTIVFINLSSVDLLTAEWDFGDGNTSDELFPIHTYAAAGIYDVVLTITTVDGCTSTFTMTIDLENVNFTGNPSFRTTSTNNLEVIKGAKLFPNPVQDELNISLNVEEGGDGELSIVDLSGRVLIRQPHGFVQGENNIQLNLSELPEGVFFSRITLKDQVVSMKFVK